MKPNEVLAFAKENGATMLDLRFMDFLGLWQHFSVPIGQLDEGSFEDGFGFDGASIRGWQPINASDMLVIPDPATAKMDPYTQTPTLVMICDIPDPVTRAPYSRDPRYIAKKAEAYLKSTGIGDTAFMGPEAEFFIFDDVRYGQHTRGGFYYLDSNECIWNTGREFPNLRQQDPPQGRLLSRRPEPAWPVVRRARRAARTSRTGLPRCVPAWNCARDAACARSPSAQTAWPTA